MAEQGTRRRAGLSEPTPPPEPALPRPLPRVRSNSNARTAGSDGHSDLAAEVEQRTRQTIQKGLELYELLPPIQLWPSLLYRVFIVMPMVAAWNAFTGVATSPRTHRFVLRISVVSALYFAGLFFAILAYIGFVSVWAPHTGSKKVVWLQYGEDETPYARLHFARGPSSRHNPFDDSDDILGLQRTFFLDDQAYDVTLDLVVPVTSSNVDLGNFMTTLELYNANGSVVWRASRPSILLQEPAPVRALASLARVMNEPSLSGMVSWIAGGPPGEASASPLAALSWSIPTQVISIPLLRKRIMQPSHGALGFLDPPTLTQADYGRDRSRWASPTSLRVTSGLLTVGRHDRYKFESGRESIQINLQSSTPGLVGTSGQSRGELQTQSAVLRFDAHITGLRWMLYYHPILSFLTFTTLFMAFEMAVALSLWASVALYTSDTLKMLTQDVGESRHSTAATSAPSTSTSSTYSSTPTNSKARSRTPRPTDRTARPPSPPPDTPEDSSTHSDTITETGAGESEAPSGAPHSSEYTESEGTPSEVDEPWERQGETTHTDEELSIPALEWERQRLRRRPYSLGPVTEATEESTPIVSENSAASTASDASTTAGGDAH